MSNAMKLTNKITDLVTPEVNVITQEITNNQTESKDLTMTHLENLKTNAPHTITYVEDHDSEQHQVKLLNSFGLPIGTSGPMDLVFNVHNLFTVDDDALDALVALEYGEPENNIIKLFADAESLCKFPDGYLQYCDYITKLNIIKGVLKEKVPTH